MCDDVVVDENQTETYFREGQVFESYDAFKDVLTKFEKATFTKFSVVRCDKINVKPGYSSMELGCKHYGSKRRNKKLTGERPRQKTYKLNCPAVIILKRTDDKCKLRIDHLDLNHNHVTNKVTAAGYPENRRVSKEAKTQAEDLLKLRVKPTLIRPFLKNQEDPNKLILGRDISNIGTSRKKTERKGRSDEEMLQDKLNEIGQQDPGADLHIETDPVTHEVVFIFIQTTDMRENLQRFPEVMLMDVTYKINKSRMPVSVIEVMDGEGEGLPVGYAFLANETKETLTAMIKHFVQVSGKKAFESTECCVVDKAFEEIGALKEALPGVKIHICSVHTEKNFKKLAKGHKNKKECVALMKALIYCENQEDFDEVYKNLQLTADTAMMETFDKNWLRCKEAWSLKDKIVVMTLKNHSTNRVERHNRTLKMVFSVDTELFEAVSGLVGIILSNKKDDKLYKMHEALTKITYVNKCSDPVVQVICNDLTDFACKIVCEQLQLSKKSSPFPGKYQQSEVSCTCLLFKTLKLPCRHIMRYRKQSGLPIYSKEHVLQRWWKNYTIVDDSGNPSQGAAPSLSNGESENLLIQPKLPGEALSDVLEPAEKYKKFVPLVPKLKTSVCSVGTRTFYLRYQILLDLIEAWHSGTEVAIVHLSSGHIDDGNVGTVESSVVSEGGALPIPFSDQGVSQTAPFVLNKVVVKGKPAGRNDTIHDGSKKKGPPGKKRPRRIVDKNCCCVCGNEAGSHKCVKCGAVVHAIPPCSVPAPGAEEKYGMLCLCKNCQDAGNTSRDVCDDDLYCSFDSGTAENSSEGQGMASESVQTDVDTFIECPESQSEEELPNFKLGVVRTKGRPHRGKGNGPPKWNYNSLADSMPTASSKEYKCFGCQNVLHSKVTKTGPNAGRVYYSCDSKTTAKCMGTFFWKAKERQESQITPKKAALDSKTSSAVCDPAVEEEDRMLSEISFRVEEELGLSNDQFDLGADQHLPSNTSGLTRYDKEDVIDLTATTDDDSDYDVMQPIKEETSTGSSDIAVEISARCKICYLAQPDKDHRCCSKCKEQKVTENHVCSCIVCHRTIKKRTVYCFRCTRPAHAKCTSVQKEIAKGGQIVQMCDNCKISRDTGLHPSALDDLREGKSLTDEHLNAAGIMLKEAFGDLGGLTTPQNFKSFESQLRVAPHIAKSDEDYLQMLNTGTGHWVLLIVSQGQPFLLDSNYHGNMAVHVKSQITEIMSSDHEDITVLVPQIQQQNNATDCGLYVIANAVEFAFTRKIRNVKFRVDELRSHWMKCIGEGRISQFPREQREDVNESSFSRHVIPVSPTTDSDIVDGRCKNCMLEEPQPGHSCCRFCKSQNKRRGHICKCVVCSDPTSENANLQPQICKGCQLPVHEFCSKFDSEEDSYYCIFCKIRKNVSLTKEDILEILDQRPTSKCHLIIASRLLQKQYPDLAGLAEPKDVKRKQENVILGYNTAKDDVDYVQFLSTGTGHWVLLVVTGGKPFLLGNDVHDKLLTSEVESQVAAVVNCFTSEFTIYIPKILQDEDSGLLSIALAFEFAQNRDINLQISFKNLSGHWVECLLKGEAHTFPSCKTDLPVLMDCTTTKVYCVCRLPEHYSLSMIDCDVCGEWYHPNCVNVSIDTEKWVCNLCS